MLLCAQTALPGL